MIAVDTSALMAVTLEESAGAACAALLQTENEVLISAATLTEFLIVASARGLYADAVQAVADLGLVVIPVTGLSATRAADAHQRWGRGNHPARLNFGDCFAYALASEHGCPLLFVGDDFAKTDIVPALQRYGSA